MSDVMGIRERLRERRLALGMSQMEVAKEIGTAQRTISRVEGGTTTVPGRAVPALAVLLSISESEITPIAAAVGSHDPTYMPPSALPVSSPQEFAAMLLSGTPSTLRERAARWEAVSAAPVLARLYEASA